MRTCGAGKRCAVVDIKVKKATEDMKAKICSDKVKYENDAPALADALEARVNAINKALRDEMRVLDAIFLQKGKKAELDARIAGAQVRFVDFSSDNIQKVRDGKADAAKLVAVICDAPSHREKSDQNDFVDAADAVEP